ncbi:MAG: O-antigen ligase family protein [Pseudolabrys sp.]|nr:O-antigen ligase family protein [Pseudolabrys sp.]
MITARQGIPDHLPYVPGPAVPRFAPAAGTALVGFRERLLRLALFVTVVTSCIAFIEPSPHDLLVCLLLVIAAVTGLKFDRTIVALILPLLAWNVGGLVALFNVAHDNKAIQYAITSLYLAVAAVLFASLLTRHTAERLDVLRKAYIAAAMIAATAGIAGYFRLFPGAGMFTLYDRALGTFKDPNVFGPFLIWPALAVMARILVERMRLTDLAVVAILTLGLLLSFSRGAWIHFAVSSAVMLALLFFTARDARARYRLIGFSVIGLIAVLLLLAIALSISSVGDMFLQRANALNTYDVGQGGRFHLQELALGALLDHPLGMGPLEFGRVYGLQQHNVYLQALLVYGWLGGAAYFVLIGATILFGLRNVFVPTPWQPYLIVSVATLIGVVGEGMVIDSDHWRHFFVILGLVWGLSAAAGSHRCSRSAALRQGTIARVARP